MNTSGFATHVQRVLLHRHSRLLHAFAPGLPFDEHIRAVRRLYGDVVGIEAHVHLAQPRRRIAADDDHARRTAERLGLSGRVLRVAHHVVDVNRLVGAARVRLHLRRVGVQAFLHRVHLAPERVKLVIRFGLLGFFCLFGLFLLGQLGELLFHLVGLGLQRVGLCAQRPRALLIARRLLELRLGADALGAFAQRRRSLGLFLAEIDDDFALVAGQLVNRLARRLLRVAQPLADRLADAADHAARQVVHLANQLLCLRHNLLAHVAQRAEGLAQHVADIRRFFGSDLEIRRFVRFGLRGLFLGLFFFIFFIFARLFGVHFAQQALHVAQRRGHLGESFFLRLARADGILKPRLGVGHQLVAQGKVIRRHLHIGKNFIDHSSNLLVHHFDASSIPNSSDITARYFRQSA